MKEQATASVVARKPILQARELEVRYGKVPALGPVNLTVFAGDFILVVGPNGAGKTTLMRSLAGGIGAAAGHVLLNDREVTDVPAWKRALAGIVLVPEGRGVLRGLSVKENLEIGGSLARRGGRVGWSVDEVVDLFPVLGSRMDQDCAALSGGEMQMLALGRAIMGSPDVLLVDEASLGLAPRVIEIVYQAVDKLIQLGMTAVIVEQKAVPLVRVPTQTLVLQNGTILRQVRDTTISEDELASLYLKGEL